MPTPSRACEHITTSIIQHSRHTSGQIRRVDWNGTNGACGQKRRATAKRTRKKKSATTIKQCNMSRRIDCSMCAGQAVAAAAAAPLSTTNTYSTAIRVINTIRERAEANAYSIALSTQHTRPKRLPPIACR